LNTLLINDFAILKRRPYADVFAEQRKTEYLRSTGQKPIKTKSTRERKAKKDYSNEGKDTKVWICVSETNFCVALPLSIYADIL
jgi:hypothetical protein